MSRTIRRKHIKQTRNSSGQAQGFKTNGHFTIWDRAKEPINGHKGEKIYRSMTKEEVRREMKFFHGESSHRNAWSPSRDYRKTCDTEMKTHNKREMLKWVNSQGEYDPVFMDNPRNCWWDWS